MLTINEQKVERSIPVQGRVDVVNLTEVYCALRELGYHVKSLSQLVSYCVELAHHALESNKYINRKFDGPLQAFHLLEDVGIVTNTMRKRGFRKVVLSQGLEELRKEQCNPELNAPSRYKEMHNTHSLEAPEFVSNANQVVNEEEARRIAESYQLMVAKKIQEEKDRQARMIAIVEQAKKDGLSAEPRIVQTEPNKPVEAARPIGRPRTKPVSATDSCMCKDPNITEVEKEKEKKVDEKAPVNADDIDPANYDLEMSLEDRKKLTPRQQAEWRIAYQKNRFLQNQMKKQPKVNEAPRARTGEELAQFAAWKAEDLARRDKALEDGLNSFDPSSCAIKEN